MTAARRLVVVAGAQDDVWSLASSACTIASCSCSSRLASRGRQRPRSSGMLSRKKMIPPKQIQYHVFHWPAVLAAAADTALAWAAMKASTEAGTFLRLASSVATPGAETSAITAFGTLDSA